MCVTDCRFNLNVTITSSSSSTTVRYSYIDWKRDEENELAIDSARGVGDNGVCNQHTDDVRVCEPNRAPLSQAHKTVNIKRVRNGVGSAASRSTREPLSHTQTHSQWNSTGV